MHPHLRAMSLEREGHETGWVKAAAWLHCAQHRSVEPGKGPNEVV